MQNVRVARFIENTSEDHVIVAWTNNTASYAVLATLSLGTCRHQLVAASSELFLCVVGD